MERLTDTGSREFIEELSEKSGKLSFVRWFGFVPFILFLVTLTYLSFETRAVVTQAERNRLVAEINNYAGLNVRAGASAKSPVLRSAAYRERFPLLDSTNQKWLKVALHDSVGYIGKAFSVIKHEHTDEVTGSETLLINPQFGFELAFGVLFFAGLIYWLNKVDRPRFEIELYYQLDDRQKAVYQKFSEYFAEFSASAKIWQYTNANNRVDFKRNAGAGKLVKRIAVPSITGHRTPLRFFKTNVQIPNIRLKNTDLYFLPERLLIKRNNQFAAVFYQNLHIGIQTARFIENEGVPRDANVVDYTWQYVNKNGGPDRRFNGNRQLPICAYSEYTLTSGTGIYEVLTTSKNGAFNNFARLISQIGRWQEQTRAVSLDAAERMN
jgi:hypothetical protein